MRWRTIVDNLLCVAEQTPEGPREPENRDSRPSFLSPSRELPSDACPNVFERGAPVAFPLG